MVKLHLGCGPHHWKDYVNIDNDPQSKADIIMDLKDIGNEFPHNSISEIQAIHCIGYMYRHEAISLFKTVYSLLTDKGLLVIETPNARKAAEHIVNARTQTSILESVRVFYGIDIHDLLEERPTETYKWIWTPEDLMMCLRGANLNPVQRTALHHCPSRDLRVEATKDDC